MAKKVNVHLQLTAELSDIDAELELAMEALSDTNLRIDSFLNGENGEGEIQVPKATEEVSSSEETVEDDEEEYDDDEQDDDEDEETDD